MQQREVRDLGAEKRTALRQERARPMPDALHAWMLAQRLRATDCTTLASALTYSFKPWAALTRYLDNGNDPRPGDRFAGRGRPNVVQQINREGMSNWRYESIYAVVLKVSPNGALRLGRRFRRMPQPSICVRRPRSQRRASKLLKLASAFPPRRSTHSAGSPVRRLRTETSTAR